MEIDNLRQQLSQSSNALHTSSGIGLSDAEADKLRRTCKQQQFEIERLKKEKFDLSSNFRAASKEVNDYGMKTKTLENTRAQLEETVLQNKKLRKQVEALKASQASDVARQSSVLQGYGSLKEMISSRGDGGGNFGNLGEDSNLGEGSSMGFGGDGSKGMPGLSSSGRLGDRTLGDFNGNFSNKENLNGGNSSRNNVGGLGARPNSARGAIGSSRGGRKSMDKDDCKQQ